MKMNKVFSSGLLWMLATFLLTTGITLAVTKQIQTGNNHTLNVAFDDDLQQTVHQINDRLERYSYGLKGARAVILAAGDHHLSRKLFRNFVSTRNLPEEFPGARGVGFIRKVAETELPNFIKAAKEDDFSDFSVHTITPHSGDRYIIQYIEPIDRNIPAVGFDIASEESHRQAAIESLESGEVRITHPITLIHSTQRTQQTFLILLPIYSTWHTPPTVDARKEHLLGWSYMPLVMNEVLADFNFGIQNKNIKILDLNPNGTPKSIFETGIIQENNIAFRRSTISTFGRTWQVDIAYQPDFVKELNLTSPSKALMQGGVISLLLTALSGFAVILRERKAQMQKEQAQLAAIVESSLDAIIAKDLSGTITSWNKAAEKLFGYTAQEAIGKEIMALLVPPEKELEEINILENIKHGHPLTTFETVRKNKSGKLLELSVTVSPIHTKDGTIIGAAKTARDISESKAIQHRLTQLNSNLESLVTQRTEELQNVNLFLNNVLSSASTVAIIATDTAGTIKEFNLGAVYLLGYSADEVLGKTTPLTFHLPPEIQQRSAELTEKYGHYIGSFNVFSYIPEHETPECREWTYVRKDGTHLPVTLIVSAMRNNTGELTGFLGVAVDITELKAAQEKLALSLETTRAILNTAATPIITIDEQGTILTANPATATVFGYSIQELEGKNVKLLMPTTYSLQHDDHLQNYQREKNAKIIGIGRDVDAQRKDGSIFPAHISIGELQSGEHRIYVGIITDISTLHSQQKQLQAIKDKLLLASDVAQLGIWTWHIKENILDWNDLMFEFYQWPKSIHNNGLNYEHWRSRVHPEDVVATEISLQEAIEGTGVYDPIFRIIRPDGSIRFIHAAAYIERDETGTAISVTGINRDVTSEQQLETSLLAAKHQADLANSAKSSFLANMSHEIRTPLNAVLGMLQLLKQTTMTERQAEFVDKANMASRSLLGLLNDILDYSKIEAGKLILDMHAFEIADLLNELSIVLTGNLGSKDVEVVFDIGSNLPNTIVTDKLRLLQVLINLAGNALKFTPRGLITVEVSLIRKDEENEEATLHFSVTDTGIGISKEQQSRIFDGFTQAETSTTRRFGGTGLGLIISKRLVHMMGGELTLESEVDKGTRFSFDLTVNTLEDPFSQENLWEDSRLESARVLIVVDKPVIRDLLIRYLGNAKISAECTADGQSAIKLLQQAHDAQKPFNVVLLDCQLSSGRGREVGRQIRGLPITTPAIIIITAYGKHILEDAAQEGFAYQAFISKPFTPTQIITAIRSVMGDVSTPASSLPSQQDRRLEGLRILVVEDNALNRQVAQGLLEMEGAQVELAESGAEGIEKLQVNSRYNVVLMDMQMPEMDGLEATRRIRQNERFQYLPILAMTANASEADKQMCLEAGMNDHIAKPIDMDVVVNKILIATAGHQPETATTLTKETQEQPELIDAAAQILRRFAENSTLYNKLLTQYLIDANHQIAEIRTALITQDKAKIQAAMHTIKGVSATMGAKAAAKKAEEWESLFKAGADLDTLNRLQNTGLSELAVLIEISNTALCNLFKSDADATPANESRPKEELLLIFNKLKELLAFQNLTALDLAETVPQIDAPLQPQWALCVTRINELDFKSAAEILEQLIERLQ